KERQRRLAREKYERQQARRVHHARRWRSGLIIALVCLTVVGTGTGAYFLLRGGSKPASAAPASPDSKASYRATIVTNRGDVVIDLLNAKATCTVNSFVYLAAKKYFNNTH